MKVGGVIPKQESLYKGSLILPTLIPPFEASDYFLVRFLSHRGCRGLHYPGRKSASAQGQLLILFLELNFKP